MTVVTSRKSQPNELIRFAEEHPVEALAAAFGIGYVLAGALFSKTTFRALEIAMRTGIQFAAPAIIQAALVTRVSDGQEPVGGR